MRTLLALVAVLLFVGAHVAYAGRERWVWWEGEDAFRTNFPDDTWFSARTFPERRDGLSGGDWLTNAGRREGEVAFAEWRVAVPQAGAFDLWCRKFWKHGPFRWRFDRRKWRECGRDIGLIDSMVIRTHLCVNWVYLGTVQLSKGGHLFELQLLAGPGEQLTAAFDCFVLSRAPRSQHRRAVGVEGSVGSEFFPDRPPGAGAGI